MTTVKDPNRSPEELALLSDYEAVLGAPSGRRVLAHIINDLCRVDAVHDLSKTKYAVDALEQRFAGRREAGIELVAYCKEASHPAYQRLVAERLQAEQAQLAMNLQSLTQNPPEE